MKVYEESIGNAIVPHLLCHPLGATYSISPDKKEIIVGLLTGKGDEQPLFGYRIATELFLKITINAIQLLARLGYKPWDSMV